MRTSIDDLIDLDAVARERAQAVRAVASAAGSAEECRDLLDALGLEPAEGRANVPEPRSGS